MDFVPTMDESLLLHIKTEPEIIIEEDSLAAEFNFLDDGDDIKQELDTEIDEDQNADNFCNQIDESAASTLRDNRYVCAVCGLSFNFCYEVLLHLKVHSAEDPRVCPICDIDFTSENTNTLALHVMRHTGEYKTKKRNFTCKKCGEQFDGRNLLYSHIRTHSNKISSINLYKCSICDLEFNRIRELTLHIRGHSN